MTLSFAGVLVSAALLYDGPRMSETESMPDEAPAPPAIHHQAGQSYYQRMRRAGRPNRIADWADFTYGPKYRGYYIGGGAPFYSVKADKRHGEPRYSHEGTWGMDYNPWYSRVRLQWYHGRRRQDGEGQYEPDECNNPVIPLFFR